MTIESTWTNNRPMALLGMAGSMDASVVTPYTEEDSYDICICERCDYEEMAFVNNGGEYWKNDYKTILEKRVFSADTITFKLLDADDSDAVLATLNASTYGTYYDFGNALFADYPNYKGFEIDWNLVQLGFGYGRYKLRVERVSLGTTYTKDSHVFNVVEFTETRANGTVRIETYQNGNLQKRFDYTGLNWRQSTRIKGFFGNKKPTLIIDNYEDFNREVREIQGKIEDTYYLNTDLLKAEIFNYLNYNGLRGNTILITDYNKPNQEIYRRKSIYLTNFEDIQNHMRTAKSSFYYSFKDKVNNDIKRNVKGDSIVVGSPVSIPPNGGNICTLYVEFNSGDANLGTKMINARSAGVYTSITDDGASGTITISKNAGTFIAFASPLTLVAGDTLDIARTVDSADGWVALTGTF